MQKNTHLADSGAVCFFVLRLSYHTLSTHMQPLRTKPVVGLFGDRVTRLYPNGECVVYRQRIKKLNCVDHRNDNTEPGFLWDCWHLFLTQPAAFSAACLHMGLSLVYNLDKWLNPSDYPVHTCEPPKKRYGQNGITRSGARKVRNAAYLMQKRFGLGRLSFATVTVPDLSYERMADLHENWAAVVERYRLGVKRQLQRKGLVGDIITVSEVQEKRLSRSKLPVLHLHSLWVGRLAYGGWALKTLDHDRIWKQALRVALPTGPLPMHSACNIQEVKSSASGYMGKYMSKGSKIVKDLVEQGFGGWLPKQWWNMSRALSRWVSQETLTTGEFSEFLLDNSNSVDHTIWEFVGHVTIDIGEKQEYWLATYGRLNSVLAEEIRKHCNLTEATYCCTL